MDAMAAIRETFFQECAEQLAEIEAGLDALDRGDGRRGDGQRGVPRGPFDQGRRGRLPARPAGEVRPRLRDDARRHAQRPDQGDRAPDQDDVPVEGRAVGPRRRLEDRRRRRRPPVRGPGRGAEGRRPRGRRHSGRILAGRPCRGRSGALSGRGGGGLRLPADHAVARRSLARRGRARERRLRHRVQAAAGPLPQGQRAGPAHAGAGGARRDVGRLRRQRRAGPRGPRSRRRLSRLAHRAHDRPGGRRDRGGVRFRRRRLRALDRRPAARRGARVRAAEPAPAEAPAPAAAPEDGAEEPAEAAAVRRRRRGPRRRRRGGARRRSRARARPRRSASTSTGWTG